VALFRHGPFCGSFDFDQYQATGNGYVPEVPLVISSDERHACGSFAILRQTDSALHELSHGGAIRR